MSKVARKRPPYVPQHPPEHWIAKFWARVTKTDGCWIHSGPLHVPRWGYPQVRMPTGKMGRSHRMSWELHHGPVTNGLWVLHRCHNSRCVNPDHLYLGDHKQNMDDMARAKRSPRKLTAEQVRDIRSSKESQRALASKHGIHQASVWMVLHHRTHRYE